MSYGRKDASALADRVAEFLVEQGFRVWRDRPEIKPGVPFLEKIADAIRESQLVVALLSPHSVRRVGDVDDLDSVCLDELSYARFGKPARAIVPAMAVTCEPPMVIFRLDYVDLTDKAALDAGLARLREGIDDALAGRVRYRSWVDSLNPWDFAPFLQEKQTDFVGREWLHAQVADWLAHKGHEPALLLKGDPGAGKSAFVASLVARNPSALLGYHCCQANTPETIRPGRFVRSIAAMIASRVPAYEHRLASLLDESLAEARCDTDPFSSFEAGVLAPLSAIEPPGGVAFLLIDALDETLAVKDAAAGQRAGATAPSTIVDVLADRLGRFPKWLRIVATTRRDPAILRRLRGLRYVDIDVHSDENRRDVEAYVRLRGAQPDLASIVGDEDRLEHLVVKMREAGNFLFVAEMLRALARDRTSLDDLDRLPAGLYGLYEIFFERTFPHGDDPARLASAKTLLSVMLAAQQPLADAELAEATELDSESTLPATLNVLAPYLRGRADEQGVVRYSVYHKSFADWLQDPELRGTPFYVSVKTGHARLAAKLTREYAHGVARLSDYSLAHGPLHLGAAGELERLYDLLRDASYLSAVARKLGVGTLLRTFERGRDAFPDGAERDTVSVLAAAVRLSITAVAQEPTEFEVQMEARLRDQPTLAPFLEALRARFAPDVLVPQTEPLTSAGGALLMPLKSGFAVTAVCVHEASGQVVTGDEQGQLRVWSLDSGAPILTADVSPLSISCGACDLTRPEAVFGTFEGTIVHLDLETGDVRTRDAKTFGDVGDLHLDATQRKLLTVHTRSSTNEMSENGTLACWSWPTLELQWKRTMRGARLRAVRWNGDGSAIYVVSGARLIRTGAEGKDAKTVREAARPQVEPIDGEERRGYDSLALRDDGLIALGCDDGRIELVDADSGGLVRQLEGHPMEFYTTVVSGLCFIGTRELVSAGWDDAIRVWDVETGREVRSVRGTSKVNALAVYAGGSRAVSGHKMLAANVWSLHTPGRVEGENGSVKSLHADEGLGVAAAQVGYRRVAIWRLDTGSVRHLTFAEPVICVGLDVEHEQVLVLNGNRIDAVHATEDSDRRHALGTIPAEDRWDGAWSPNGQILAAPAGASVVVWRRDHRKAQRFALPKDEHTIFDLQVCDSCLAVGTAHEVRFFALSKARPRPRAVALERSPHTMALSPDGRTAAVVDEEGLILGFDTRTGERIWALQGSEWISRVCLTDSGELCVITEDDLSIWNTQTRSRLAHLRSENRWGDCWMPADGSYVLVGGSEHRLHRLHRSRQA